MPCVTCLSSSHSSPPDGGGRDSDATVSDRLMNSDTSTRSLRNHMIFLTHRKCFSRTHGTCTVCVSKICDTLQPENTNEDPGFGLIRRAFARDTTFFVSIGSHQALRFAVQCTDGNIGASAEFCVLRLQVYVNAQVELKCVE